MTVKLVRAYILNLLTSRKTKKALKHDKINAKVKLFEKFISSKIKSGNHLKIIAPRCRRSCAEPRFGRGSVYGFFFIGIGALRVVNQLLQPQEGVAGPRGRGLPGIDWVGGVPLCHPLQSQS